MMKVIDKRRHQAVTPIYLTLIFSILITISFGQDNKKLLQDSVAESKTILNGTSVNGNEAPKQIAENPWVDPLFFIEGQLCQHVRKIFQDKSGNLWFGTNVYGLMRYNGDTLEYFDEKRGIGGGRITGIVEDKEGNVWFGTYKGLSKYDARLNEGEGQKTIFTNFTEKDGLLNNEIWSLIIDRTGVFWIGTNEGLCRFDGKTFSTVPIPKAQVKDTTTIYAYDRITSIIEDQNGILWIGTDGFGICKYDARQNIDVGQDKTFTHITKENGLCDNTIHDIMEDSKGNIWIGTYWGGVSMYDGETFTNFTTDGVISGVEVCGFYEDKKGSIWFAVENNGVYRYDANSKDSVGKGKLFTNLNQKEGLITNGILSIFEDKEERFWFGGWGGLFRYDGNSFSPVTKDGSWEE